MTVSFQYATLSILAQIALKLWVEYGTLYISNDWRCLFSWSKLYARYNVDLPTREVHAGEQIIQKPLSLVFTIASTTINKLHAPAE